MSDAEKYCKKCKKRFACSEPLCYPIETMLKKMETKKGRLPIGFIREYEYLYDDYLNSENHFGLAQVEWPQSGKSNKQLICEFYFEHRIRPMDIARKLNICHSYVYTIINNIKRLAKVK